MYIVTFVFFFRYLIYIPSTYSIINIIKNKKKIQLFIYVQLLYINRNYNYIFKL